MNTIHASTYSGDNYPGHQHHKPAVQAGPAGPLQRSVNDLAFAINRQEDLLKVLADRTKAVSTGPVFAGSACEASAVHEPRSKFREDIDGQTSRIAAANNILEAIIESLEI